MFGDFEGGMTPRNMQEFLIKALGLSDQLEQMAREAVDGNRL
jgi:hypothetical protein